MEIDRQTLRQVGFSGAAALVFLLGVIVVSQTFATDGGVSPTGGFALVAVIAFFVVLMGAIGVWMFRVDDE